MAKETLVNKSDTFEDWRQKSNDISLDLGAVASNQSYNANSLDIEPRLTDQYVTKSDLGDGGLYIRDVTTLPNGLEIDYSADRKVDNTDGYIILKEGVTNTGDFIAGDQITQYADNATGSAAIFTAVIVSISAKKILVENVTSTSGFNAGLNLYKTADLTKLISHTRLKDLIVESYSYGNVRLYRTRNYSFDATAVNANRVQLSVAAYAAVSEGDIINYTAPADANDGIFGSANATTVFYVKKTGVSGTRFIKLETSPGGGSETLSIGTGTQTLVSNALSISQDMTRDGFHIAPHNHFVTTTGTPTIPVTFIEGEVLYQGTIGSETFKGTLLTADISGVLIFKNVLSGAFNAGQDLLSTTVVNGAGGNISGADITIAANKLSSFTSVNPEYAQMIEFSSPGVAGDEYKVFFGSAVDAILELQDDIGEITLLDTNDKTDVVTSINELETAIRGGNTALVVDDLGSTSSPSAHPSMTANNLIDAVLEHEVDLYGTSGSLASLDTNDKTTFVAAINELETAIRGADTDLVGSDLGVTVAPYTNSGTNLKLLLEELVRDIGGAEATPQTNVGILTTPTKTLATHSSQINSTATVLTMASSPITAGIKVGMFASGHGSIDTTTGGGAFVTAVSSTQVTLSRPITGNIAASQDIDFKVEDLTTKIKAIDTLISNTTLTTNSNITLVSPPTLTDTLAKIIALVGTDTDWKNIGVTTQTVGAAQGSAGTGITLSTANPAIKVGQVVTGTDIDTTPATVVAAISGTALTLSQASTSAVGLNTVLTFTEADTLANALDFIHREIGDVSALSNDNLGTVADTPGDLSTAINNIKAFVGVADISDIDNGSDNTITSALDQIYTDIGEVGASGVELTNTALPSAATDLTLAVKDIVSRMTDAVEFDTQAFHASHENGLAGKDGYSQTNFLAAIREIQTYLGDVRELSNSGDTYQVNASTSDAGGTPASTTLTLGSNANAAVDVGYQVSGTGIQADTTIIKKVSATQFILSKTHTVADSGVQITFTEPTGYGFADDVITTSLIALRTALVGGTADLDDKIATLVDSDGAGTDFAAGNIVDAIRELQDDLGQRSLISSSINGANAGTFNSDTYTNAINSILTVIGSENISGIHGTTHTLSHTIKKLHDELGDVTANAMGTTASTVVTAIRELHNEIGSSNISTVATTDNTITTAINQLHHEIGDVSGSNTRLGISTDRAVLTAGDSDADQRTLNLVDVIKLVPGMRVYGTGIETGATIVTIGAGGNSVVLSADITTNISGDSQQTIVFKAETLQVKALALDTNTGDVGTIGALGGYVATTLVGGLTEIQGKIGNVSAINMGTTASTVVTAINEIAGEIGDVTANAMGTTATNIAAAIKEIHDGHLELVDSADQTINSNLIMTTGNTFTFPAGSTLDVSSATFTVAAADADFKIANKAVVLEGTSSQMGLIIERENLSAPSGIRIEDDVDGVQSDDDTNPSIIWDESRIFTGGNDITNKRGWVVTGLTALGAEYTQPIVDFENAQYLFANNTETDITVGWDGTNKNFDVSLNNLSPSPANTYGSAALVPVITVDAKGRITSVSTANVSNSLGTFKLQVGDGATSEQTVSLNNATRFVGTSNEITTAISTVDDGATKIITIGLPDDVTIGDDLTVTGELAVSGTGASTFAGDVTVTGNVTADSFVQTGGGASLSFSTGSTSISSKSIILNSLVDNAVSDIALNNDQNQAYVPAGAFVINRGFKSTQILPRDSTLTKGKRYRIKVIVAADQPEMKAIAGLEPTATDFVAEDIFTAASNGNNGIATDSTTRVVEQETEAKIAWNETTDEFELYKGSDTSAGTIVTQGDTLDGNTQYTIAEEDNDTACRILLADSSGTSKLLSDNALKYNSATNTLTVDQGSITAATGTSAFGALTTTGQATLESLEVTNDTTLDGDVVVGKDTADNSGAHNVLIRGASAYLRLQELRTNAEVVSNGSVTNPEWMFIADGGSYNIRLNNGPHVGASPYPFAINTNANRDAVSDIFMTALSGINLRTNDTSLVASTLSHLAGQKNTISTFIGRTQYTGGNTSKLKIQDVRILGEINAAAATSATASKRIQHTTAGGATDNGTFIDFQATSSTYSELRLGGYRSTAVKTFVSGLTSGSTTLYHNTANANASTERLVTKTNGVRYYQALLRNLDAPTTTGSTLTHGQFKDVVPVADIKGNVVIYTAGDAAPAAETTKTQFVIRNGSGGNGVISRSVGLSLKHSNDADLTESRKGFDIFSESVSAWSNNPNLHINRADGLKYLKMKDSADIAFYKFNNSTNTSFTAAGAQSEGMLWDANTGHLAIGNRDHIIQTDMVASEWTAFGNGPQALLHITGGNTAGNVRADAKLIVEADGGNESGANAEASIPIIQLRSDGTFHESEFKHNGGANNTTGYLANSTIIADQGMTSPDQTTQHAIQFATGGNATRQTNGRIDSIARMTILHDGNVGIGTNAPTAKLHVDGTVTTGALTTTGDVIIGPYDQGNLSVGTINAAAAEAGSPQQLVLNAGESSLFATGQTGESVYINAESGLQVNSHPKNWGDADGATAGWAGKNPTVSINKPDGSSEFNQITHTGLTMTSGSDIDQLYTLGPVTIGATDYNSGWVDTTINGTDLTTGSYMIQLYVNEGGGGVYQEFYTGVMSWFAGGPNSTESDEIVLHNAGHASLENDSTRRGWFLRTTRTVAADTDDVKLQIRSQHNAVDTGTYTIKLRRMI